MSLELCGGGGGGTTSVAARTEITLKQQSDCHSGIRSKILPLQSLSLCRAAISPEKPFDVRLNFKTIRGGCQENQMPILIGRKMCQPICPIVVYPRLTQPGNIILNFYSDVQCKGR
jgi:hypothetical protein